MDYLDYCFAPRTTETPAITVLNALAIFQQLND
jgi:hypothetical protein